MAEQQIDIPAQRDPIPAFQGDGDQAAWLPAPARKKFKLLRARAEQARLASRTISEKRTALRAALDEEQDKLDALTLPGNRYTRNGRDGHGLPANSPQVRAAQVQIVSMREDMAEIDKDYTDDARGELLTLVRSIEEWLGRHGRATLRVIHADAPVIKKGLSISEAIEARRRRLRELAADLRAVEQAPWPSSVTKALAREQLEELAKRGRPDVFGLVERCQPIGWPTLPVTSATAELPQIIRDALDVPALLAWALGPALVAAMEQEIDQLSDDAHALMPEQRKERRQQILTDTLATEREEEALIELGEAQGIVVRRRSNADVRAVLGLASNMHAAEERIGVEAE